ncbi:MAG TPA: hypothetical protein VE758_07605, partial [Chthoniobacterales bacterium]|nr:hypothetical protein [Chthoniobacterales bacterium]
MNDLAIYLNDHLAGSIGALEMLDDIIDKHEGDEIERFVAQLRTEIKADQQQLKRLMENLEVHESSLRKAGGWVAEKFSRGKLRAGDSRKPNLALLQSFESLTLGIAGKRLLWRVLASGAAAAPRLSGFDFA